MRVTRAVASLLLLALILGAQAENKCANCGLGEGDDPCNCGNSVVRAQKLTKPEFFASPEAIKNALKRKSNKPAPSPVYTSPAEAAPAYNNAPASTYGVPASAYIVPAASYSVASSAYSSLPAPSPVSYSPSSTPPPPPTPSPPCRSKSYVQTTCRNNTGSYGNGIKHSKDNEDFKNLLSLTPGTSIAPKFEPIGDLCHSCKGYKNDNSVIGVIPAYPGKLPCKCPKPKSKPTTVPVPQPTYPAPAPSPVNPIPSQTPIYSASALSYIAPAPSYSAPTLSYSAPSSLYSAPAPSYNAPAAPAQYAPAYQIAAPASYSRPSPSPITSNTPAFTPDSAQHTLAHQQSDQIVYVVGGVPPSPPAQIVYGTTNQEDKQKTITMPETTSAPVQYQLLAQYASAYQQPAPDIYEQTVSAPTVKKPCKKSNPQSDYDNDKQEVQTYVEIQLQKEQAPEYTADPVSISLAYKNLVNSQGKKHVSEDSLAYGHYKEPADGRIFKRVSNFDEEKLHTLDKPVVELKCGKCGSGDCQNFQVSYGDLGYGPVAPSKNRFVPKTDDAINPPYGTTIIYVPPPEDKNSLPCGPLGPTIPGYKPGSVVHGNSNGKPTCGCCGKTVSVQEGSRQIELLGCKCQKNNQSEEYESGNSKDEINERIKSSSCNCKQSKY